VRKTVGVFEGKCVCVRTLTHVQASGHDFGECVTPANQVRWRSSTTSTRFSPLLTSRSSWLRSSTSTRTTPFSLQTATWLWPVIDPIATSLARSKKPGALAAQAGRCAIVPHDRDLSPSHVATPLRPSVLCCELLVCSIACQQLMVPSFPVAASCWFARSHDA
jgi:hypothetical protein